MVMRPTARYVAGQLRMSCAGDPCLSACRPTIATEVQVLCLVPAKPHNNGLPAMQSYGNVFCAYLPGLDYTCGLQGSQVPSTSIQVSNSVGLGFSAASGIKIRASMGVAFDFEISSQIGEYT